MKSGYAATLSIAVAVVLITACNNGQSTQSYAPNTLTARSASILRRGASPGELLPQCSAKPHFAPGTFTVLAALGSFNSGTFSGSGLSLWANIKVPKGTNQTPYKAPNLGVPYTIYYGTYKLSRGMTGCFLLAKINYEGISFDGTAVAWPNVYSYGKAKPTAEGPLVIAVKGISAKAGSGTLSLKDPLGKTIETGTVSIKGSKFIE
jgi:hypothetical protein